MTHTLSHVETPAPSGRGERLRAVSPPASRPGLLAVLTLLPAGLALCLLPWHFALRPLLLSPWLEEIVFRLGLQDALSRCRWSALRRHAAVITAGAFGVAHAVLSPPAAWPASLSLALALSTAIPAWWIGRDYGRHRSLLRCVAWHAWFNAAWLLGGGSLLLTR
ncbi:CPBP family glutamic-type intramembrane protease [Roseateles sp. SL47]|uniref:JDVT-CTERM system glutamic-type intramembrane protease n=1 Tax=Roseateles sp. SL47 TaxID=2995138 RepID=UPI0022713DC4|nr:JDVT-CTERM system glutamic-type intramembrane protease [Roseateles sp. SL47]WAC71637.1 CPBP family glutamic-type intramembrane protease [Roseateles sp. SL47]